MDRQRSSEPKKKWASVPFSWALTALGGLCEEIGGASRDRTDDLFHAMEALSQLSYSPTQSRGKVRIRPSLVKPDRTRT